MLKIYTAFGKPPTVSPWTRMEKHYYIGDKYGEVFWLFAWKWKRHGYGQATTNRPRPAEAPVLIPDGFLRWCSGIWLMKRGQKYNGYGK